MLTNPMFQAVYGTPADLPFLTFYAKTGGKNGKDEAVLETKSNISAFSYIALQLYEYSGHAGVFTAIPEATSILQTVSYALLPPIHILAVVNQPRDNDGQVPSAMLTPADFALYNDICMQGSSDNKIFAAVDSSKSRKKKKSG
ncbi:hypothetical protein Moror_14129 [Moniliophthora roreri MCA 2997]|uniref:Uncharacterized protein n=1 Tax=Moniliophthora roreri (strain MCA 2997) TaxID=1381753 RepID=V2XPR9_MONRO|nr:hypothetical protein Moror_14129 [Moniliophthora roreri MCA 2997]